MPLAEAPSIEDEIVAGDVDESLVERTSGRHGQNDVLERPPRLDRVDRAAGARTKQAGQRYRHAFTSHQLHHTSGDVQNAHRRAPMGISLRHSGHFFVVGSSPRLRLAFSVFMGVTTKT